ncbi:MAG: hypothetical protein ACI9MC_000427 [Kiritimatiellia bacterium]
MILAGSVAFTVVTPEDQPEYEWHNTGRTCGVPGDIDEACVERGPWLLGLPRVEAVRRARLYHYLQTQRPSPIDAVPVSLVELSSYAQDDASEQLALDLAADAWLYAPSDVVADDIVAMIEANDPRVQTASERVALDVQRYEALVQIVLEKARETLAVIESGNVKAWSRRTSATVGWMGMATPFMALGVGMVIALLSTLLIARRQLWGTASVKVQPDGMHLADRTAPWSDIKKVVLGPGPSQIRLRDGDVLTGPALELSGDDENAIYKAIDAHLT